MEEGLRKILPLMMQNSTMQNTVHMRTQKRRRSLATISKIKNLVQIGTENITDLHSCEGQRSRELGPNPVRRKKNKAWCGSCPWALLVYRNRVSQLQVR